MILPRDNGEYSLPLFGAYDWEKAEIWPCKQKMCSTTRDLGLQMYALRPNYFVVACPFWKLAPSRYPVIFVGLISHFLVISWGLTPTIRSSPDPPPSHPHTHTFRSSSKASTSGPVYLYFPFCQTVHQLPWTIRYIIVGKPIRPAREKIQKFTL